MIERNPKVTKSDCHENDMERVSDLGIISISSRVKAADNSKYSGIGRLDISFGGFGEEIVPEKEVLVDFGGKLGFYFILFYRQVYKQQQVFVYTQRQV
jgi:hypothetical protein